MSTPSADDGPDKVLTKPTFTLSAAAAAAAATASAAMASAFAARRYAITCISFSGSNPDLQDVVEWRLAVEQVDALQADAQRAVGSAHQRVHVAAAEVADLVAAQLHHVE